MPAAMGKQQRQHRVSSNKLLARPLLSCALFIIMAFQQPLTAVAFRIPISQPSTPVRGGESRSAWPSSGVRGWDTALWTRQCEGPRTVRYSTSVAMPPQQNKASKPKGLRGVLGTGPTRIRRRDLALGVVLAFLATLAAVAVPLGYGNVVDVLLLPADIPYDQRRKQLIRALQALGLIYSAEPLFTLFYVRHMTRLASQGVRNLKAAFFSRLLDKSMAFFDRTGPSEAVNYLAQDVSGLKDVFFANVQRDRGLRAVGEALLGTLLLFHLQPKLATLFALVIPTVATLTAKLGQRLIRASLSESAAIGRENSLALEVVRNIREVRSFGTEDMERTRYTHRLDGTAVFTRDAGRSRGLMECASRAAVYFSIFAVAALGGVLSQRGLMPASSLVSFIGYSFSLNFAIQGINYSYGDYQRASAMAGRVSAFLSDNSDENTDKAQHAASGVPQSLSGDAFKGHVRFEHLSFTYPNRPDMPVIRGVTMDLKPGTVTAIVGPSGAGKTTLAQLLVGFYTPTSGRISLDGVWMGALDKRFLTNQIALVGQSPNIFTGSLWDNIAYGADEEARSSPDFQSKVLEAARRANALDFIQAFPQGFDTLIGDGGVQLSGGQKQRVAIARALLKDSKILILDEATSALDAESEALVQDALDNLMQGRTTLVIAHRLGTVVRADKIVVLRKGEVVEEGRHVDLMASNAKGFYRNLMATQQTAYLNE